MNIRTVVPEAAREWTPEAAPETHPLWEEEVNLERGMMRAGPDKVRDRVLIAESRGQMTRTTVVRGLLTDWLPGVAEAVKSWVSDVEKSKGGPKPIAYPYLKDMDPYVAALIALRAVLDGIAKQRHKLTGLAMEIGRTCEHEQRVRHWEATEPGLFYHYQDELERNHSTATHRRRVNINRFNALLKAGDTDLHWDAWTHEVHFRVGVALLDVLIRKTGWFELQADPEHAHRMGRPDTPQLVFAAKPGLLEWLGKAMEHTEVNTPEYHPTVMPPRRWTAGSRHGRGGYWTPYVNTPSLVRFKMSSADRQRPARTEDEYDALDMPHVYDAIHLLQETAWQVNKCVLEVALTVWAKAGEAPIAGLPQIDERPLPPRTPRMAEHLEAVRQARVEHRVRPMPDEETDREILEWKRRASSVYKFNAKRLSRSRAASSTILLAQQYAAYERIYFPHMLDFRGRIYPIPSFLQPQGNDLARGLLTFADGLPITEENGGAGWLAIQLATSWGVDKVSFDERIRWVEENEVQWRLIAADPVATVDLWGNADKPFQALAAIFEWVDFLNAGWGFVSRLPVMVDGTCNGIQHLSAILRDPITARYVNLLPADKPQDIYKHVARELQAVLERIERAGGPQGELATYWLELTGRDLPRTLTKRQVMVLPYGGTKDSFFGYTRVWLDEADPLPDTATPEDRTLRSQRVVFLAGHLWGVVNTVVSSGMRVMKWLQDCAKAVAVANQPIYWTVPSGFVVRHFYGLDKRLKCTVMLDGERVQVTRVEKTAQLSTKEQTQGIAPNFIHSLDAAALVECLKRCREAGIEDFASVHDAYGTHAANMDALNVLLREAFVAVHERDVLGEFRAACQRVLVDWLVVGKGLDPLEASERADGMLPPPLETESWTSRRCWRARISLLEGALAVAVRRR